jgi:hypothetical protein
MTTGAREAVRGWRLERYLLDELPPGELRDVEEALAASGEVRERLEDLRLSNDAILREHPPAAVAAQLRARAAASAPSPSRAARVLAPALAALAAVLIAGGVLIVRRHAREQAPRPDVTRVKGVQPYLLLFRQAAPVERLAPGALVHEHDRLQVAYQAAGRRYGVIVSVDGAGAVTRHLPASGDWATPLATGGPVPLGASYELDDAPGFERFVLVTADAPFAVETVVDAARRQPEARLDLPEWMDQFSFVLRKEPHR